MRTLKPILYSFSKNENKTRSEASSHVAIYANTQSNVCLSNFDVFKMDINFANICQMLIMN